jgi:protein KTI12
VTVHAHTVGCFVALSISQIQLAAPEAKCREWNAARPSEQRYKPETCVTSLWRSLPPTQTAHRLDGLLVRYEEPSYAVRWDTPLIIVPPTDEVLPKDAIMQAVLHGDLKPPTTAAVSVR